MTNIHINSFPKLCCHHLIQLRNDLNIESLSIEISANSNNALKALDKLVEKLDKLKQATSGGLSGAASIADGLRKIAEAAQEFNKIDGTKLTEIANAIKSLNGLQSIADLSSTVKQMKNLSKVAVEISNLPDIPAEKRLTAQNISSILSALSSVPAVTDLSANLEQIKNLSKIAVAIAALPDIPADKLQITQNIVAMLSSLSTIPQLPDLSSTARSLSQLSSVATSIAATDMTAFAQRIQELANALQPLTALGKTNLNSFINSLKKLPDITTTLAAMDMSEFARQMNDIAAAIHPLITEIQNMANAYSQLPAPIQRAIIALVNLNQQASHSADVTNLWGKALKALNITGVIALSRRLKNILAELIDNSTSYVENLNLFNVAMGDAADQALEFAEKVNAVMGIDVSTWIKNQGTFKAIATGFGMVNDKADLLSQNLTQLGYDISSYFNISVEESMLKLQSGISGELEPLRRIGYALDVATLQQVAYNHGITESIMNMTQAQKAQIRYIAIMEQSGNVMQDMARTLESPANQLRIFNERVNQLKRSLGDALMPVVSALLPYITAFVQLLGEAARKIAEFMGFELPVFDYSGVISSGNDEITASFDDATAAAKEFKGTLSSIDQLNIIGSETTASGTGTDYGYDLDIDLPTYDFLAGLEENTSKAYETLKNFFTNILKWIEEAKLPIETTVTLLGTLWATSKIGAFVSSIKKLATANSAFGKLSGAAAGATTAFVGFYTITKDLVSGNGSVWELVGGVSALVGAVALFISTGNPLGAVLTVIGAAIGAVIGASEAINKANEEMAKTELYAQNGGIAVSSLADGFSSYFDTITSKYDDILANTKAFEDNQTAISNAADEIYKLTDKYTVLGGTMTEEDANQLRSNLEIISDGVSENLGIATQDIVDSLKTKFHDFAVQLGFDVDDMVGKFYILQSMGNTTLGSLKQQANELANEIINAGEVDPTTLNELNDVLQKMSATTTVTAEDLSFTSAIQGMLTADIDFMDENELNNAIQQIQEEASAAKATIQEAKESQVAELINLKSQYESMGVDIEFDTTLGAGSFDKLFEDYNNALEAAYEAELHKIEAGAGTFFGAVNSKINTAYYEASLEVVPNLSNYYWGFDLSDVFEGKYWENVTDLAKDDLKKNNFDPLLDMVSQAAAEIDVDAEEYKDAGIQLMVGLAEGIINNSSDVYDAIDQIAKNGQLRFTEDNEIHSPSRIFAEYGYYLMQGLAQGITNNSDVVYSAIDEVSDEIMNRMAQTYSEAMNGYSNYTSEDFMTTVGPKRYPVFGSYTSGIETGSPDAEAAAFVRQYFSSQTSDAAPVINVYAEIDGDDVAAHVYSRTDRQTVYSNGR